MHTISENLYQMECLVHKKKRNKKSSRKQNLKIHTPLPEIETLLSSILNPDSRMSKAFTLED